MKKILNDNITWIVVIALVLGGYAAYSVWKSKKETANSESAEPAISAAEKA